MVVDFEQFIEPLQSLPRKIPEQAKNDNSIVGAIDKEVLIQALEQESLLSVAEEFERAISTAHAEDVSAWVEAIAQCITNNSHPICLKDLQKSLKLPIVEIWLGLLLGDFKLEQREDFYDPNGIWVS
jgi:YesN/AraC family two-component response regulator